MDEPDGPRPTKVKVVDKRVAGHAREEHPVEGQEPSSVVDEREQVSRDEHLRLQAEFANFKKRTLREQTRLVEQAAATVIRHLLPVLDNFERAIAHGEGGEGVALVYKQLREILEQQGLEEIEAEGKPFDPELHDALSAFDDAEVTEPTVREVYQRGYKLNGRIIRHAKVIVARPLEEASSQEPVAPDDDGTDAKE